MTVKICPKCGTPNEQHFPICPNCGTTLEIVHNPSSASKKKKVNALFVLIASLCTIAATVLILISTHIICINHDWKEADCVTPKTCRNCNKTVGDALGHNWKSATYTKPKTCILCGKTSGKALEHNINENAVKTPSFIGMNYFVDIKNSSTYADMFVFDVVEEDANNPSLAGGEVFKQEPAADKMVPKGSVIRLYVNIDTPDDIMLDSTAVIEGAHKHDVRKLLQDAGFHVKEVLSSNDSVPADHVISISIKKGTAYPYGTCVTMVVSVGEHVPETIPQEG